MFGDHYQIQMQKEIDWEYPNPISFDGAEERIEGMWSSRQTLKLSILVC